MYLNDDDVINVAKEKDLSVGTTFTVQEFRDWLYSKLNDQDDDWVTGIDGKFLSASQGGWRQGKLKIAIEFIEDAPEDRSYQ